MTPFGENATINIPKHTPDTSGLPDIFSEVLANLYGTRMNIKEQRTNGEWEMIGSITTRAEKPKTPRIHTQQLAIREEKPRAVAISAQIMAEALQGQNVDKGFDRFVPQNTTTNGGVLVIRT
jgi:hypothetical protein